MIKVKLNKYNLALLLAMSLSASSLTGCSIINQNPETKYEIVLDDLQGLEDEKVMEYVNSIPFSDETFRESMYNYISESPLRQNMLVYRPYETTTVKLKGVSDFTDLRLYPELQMLSIEASDIKDLSVLNGKHFSKLELIDMEIDASVLSNLNVDAIDFYHCHVTNIDKLPKNIKYIHMEYSTVGSLSFVENFDKLKGVTICNVKTSDFEYLASKKLESLSIVNMQLDDWSFLNQITTLKTLNVDYTNFEDLNDISELDKLTDLSMGYCHVSSLEGIENHKNIENLSLDSCYDLESYAPVANLPKLKTVVLTNLEMKYDPNTINALAQKGVDVSERYNDEQIKNEVIKIYNSIGITDDMSDLEKVRRIVLKVQKIIEIPYDEERDEYYLYDINQHVLRSGIEGYGVCGTFSGMTKALCDLAGVKCYTIVGECIEDVEDLLHIWNIVEIDGKWYGIDNTFLKEEENAYNNISSNGDSRYYMDSFDDPEWYNTHMPYYVPSETLNEYYKIAK